MSSNSGSDGDSALPVPDRAKIEAHLAKLRSQPSFNERYPVSLITSPEYDDENPTYIDGFYHQMSRAERIVYYKQVTESDGFDVQDFPGAMDFGIIIPVNPDHDLTTICRNANLAIEQHNEKHGENLELVDIVKCNCQMARPMNYYITFKAKDAQTGEEDTYQAKVNWQLPDEDTYVSIPLRRASKRKQPQSEEASGSSPLPPPLQLTEFR